MTRLDRSLLHAATAVTGLSGLAHAGFKYLMSGGDPFSAVNHPLQPWALKLHVLAAPALVFAVGLIFKDHIVGKARNGASGAVRRSGLLTAAIFVPSILTGYLLPAMASDAPRRWVAWAHIGFGVLLLLAYGAHLLVAPARAVSREEAAGGPPARGVTVTGLQITRRNGAKG